MTDPQKRRERLRRLAEGYAAAGLPLTSQRRTLIEVLASRTDHPTVDQIHGAVAALLPEVSKTTVYRSLEVLSDLGLIQRVEHPGSSVRYDANLEPHHHFLCTGCGALADLPLEAVRGSDALAYVGDAQTLVEEVAIIVRGRCRDCAAGEGS